MLLGKKWLTIHNSRAKPPFAKTWAALRLLSSLIALWLFNFERIVEDIKNILIGIVLLTALHTYGQQHPLYTQYYNNFSLINPAYSGSHGLFTATADIRSQWAGLVGGPETQTLSLHGPVGKNVGLGLSIVNDKVFVLNETHLFADFSYSIETSDNAILAFGLKAGGSFLNVDLFSLVLKLNNVTAINKASENFNVLRIC